MINPLAKLSKARTALAAAKSLSDVTAIRDVAKAAEAYAKAAHLGVEMQNDATEVRLLAERKAGEMLARMEKDKGGRPSKTGSTMEPVSTLASLGIDKKESHRWQKLAAIPATEFEAGVAIIKEKGERLSAAGIQQAAFYQSSESVEWPTPQWLFDLLNAEFKFRLDVCATKENAKCGRYFTPQDNGLLQEWVGACWMNPPYGSEIADWMEKARASADAGATVVCLVPARTDTDWWQQAIRGEIRFLHGRVKFVGSTSGATFPSAVVVMRPGDDGSMWGPNTWWDVHE